MQPVDAPRSTEGADFHAFQRQRRLGHFGAHRLHTGFNHPIQSQREDQTQNEDQRHRPGDQAGNEFFSLHSYG